MIDQQLGTRDAVHHPVVKEFELAEVIPGPGFRAEFPGVRTRLQFVTGSSSPALAFPAFDEEYFEWLDVLETVQQADDEFVMVEIGAGYGRWSIRAAAAVRQKPGCRFRGIAIEAEPTHFRWMLDHFRDNGLNPDDHELIWAAIGASPGFVPFWVGDANSWYGQAVSTDSSAPLPDARQRRRLKARSALGRPPVVSSDTRSIVWVPCVTLTDVLSPYPRIDLLDLDIQGLEYEVLASAIELVSARVRRVHIGTHSPEVERDLRALFTAHGWKKVTDYPCFSQSATPYGMIDFNDGVQTWVNYPLMARLRREQRRDAELLAALLGLVDDDAADPLLVVEAAETAEKVGKLSLAAELYTRVLTRTTPVWLADREQLIAFRLGSLLKRLGEHGPAAHHLERSLAAASVNPAIRGAAHFHLAELTMTRGDRAKALEHLHAVFEFIPNHEKARERLREFEAT